MRELVRELALALRERVLPLLGAHAQRAHSGASDGGDVTFAIDAAAEELLERFLAERAPDVAFYSEDRGLVASEGGSARAGGGPDRRDAAGPRRPRVVLRIGRGGPAGRRAALPRHHRRLRGRDQVRAACSSPGELSSRGCPRTSASTGCSGRSASAGGRRGELTEVLAELIDASSVGGAVFDLGSSAFNMTRVITGQLDAVRRAEHADLPGAARARGGVRRVGAARVLTNPPYDLAGAWALLARGGRRGDRRARAAAGRSPPPRLGRGAPDLVSWRPPTRVLHEAILGEIEVGIARLHAARE